MSAYAKHKAEHKMKELFKDCFYCRDEQESGQSSWKWLKQFKAGEYRNKGGSPAQRLEAHRVGKRDALMALKWNNHDIKLERVLALMPQWEPLFGHLTKDGPGSQTYWVMLRRK